MTGICAYCYIITLMATPTGLYGLYVCSKHLSVDCFGNEAQCNTGFTKKLLLKDEVMTTALDLTAATSQHISKQFLKSFVWKLCFYREMFSNHSLICNSGCLMFLCNDISGCLLTALKDAAPKLSISDRVQIENHFFFLGMYDCFFVQHYKSTSRKIIIIIKACSLKLQICSEPGQWSILYCIFFSAVNRLKT